MSLSRFLYISVEYIFASFVYSFSSQYYFLVLYVTNIRGMLSWPSAWTMAVAATLSLSLGLALFMWTIKLSQCSTEKHQMGGSVLVFDLDETLGCFVELGMFWDALEDIYGGGTLGQRHFNEVVDLFPGFMRPNILNILDYIVHHRNKGQCDQIIIYTNNQGPKTWVTKISDYISYRLNVPVFDQIVAAYKINGQQIERHRTTHDKTVPDLLRCTNLPPHTRICFLDDLLHPRMQEPNVFYINVKAYTYTMPFEEMATKYYRRYHGLLQRAARSPPSSEGDFVDRVVRFMRPYRLRVTPKSVEAERTDEQVGQQIMQYIQQFLHDVDDAVPPATPATSSSLHRSGQVGGSRKRRRTRRRKM